MGKGFFEKICDVCGAYMLDYADIKMHKWLKCHSCGFCKIKEKYQKTSQDHQEESESSSDKCR